jgi:hypothetical protein
MAMSQIATVFKLNRKGFNPSRSVSVLIMLVPLVVLGLLDQEKYYLSVAFAALFVGLSDPGGDYAYRVPRMAAVAVVGALLTALGFAIGGGAWGWVVLAALVITLLPGLAVTYGLHRFAAATLLNVWFLIVLALPSAYRLDGVDTTPWAQTLAWLAGAAATIAYTCIVWLARGRTAQAQPAADVFPGDISPVPLTRPVILFAVIRAVAVAIAVAIAFGLELPNADWMPVAALVAMKPSLAQSTLVAEQRLAGALLGAGVAALFLLTVDNKTALVAIIVVLGALAASLRSVNYAWYCAAVAGAVLIGMDLPHPSNLAEEGRRVLFTFVGVGIAVVVMLVANLLGKRSQAGAQPAPAG